jgi:hypothetical protein
MLYGMLLPYQVRGGSQKKIEADAAGARRGGLEDASGRRSTCCGSRVESRALVACCGRRESQPLPARIPGTKAQLAPHMLKPPFSTGQFSGRGRSRSRSRRAQGKRRNFGPSTHFIPSPLVHRPDRPGLIGPRSLPPAVHRTTTAPGRTSLPRSHHLLSPCPQDLSQHPPP